MANSPKINEVDDLEALEASVVEGDDSQTKDNLEHKGLPVSDDPEVTQEQISTRKRVDQDVPNVEDGEVSEMLEEHAENLGGESEEKEESKEQEEDEKRGEELGKIIDGHLGEFISEESDTATKKILVSEVKNYLSGLPEGAWEPILGKLVEFLNEKLFEKSKIVGISADEEKDLQNRIKKEGKDYVASDLAHQIDEKKAEIERLEETIRVQELDLKQYNPKNTNAQLIQERAKVKGELDENRKARLVLINEKRTLEKRAKAIEAIGKNLEKKWVRPSPKNLLTHVHYFILQASEQERLAESGKEEPFGESRKRQNELYKKALLRANQNLGEVRLQGLEKPGAIKSIGRIELRLKHVIGFAAESGLIEQFPEKNREKGKKLILRLKDINPETAEGEKRLGHWVNECVPLLQAEGKEEVLQRFLAQTIATMEGAMNGIKWKEGVSQSQMENIVRLTTGLRHAYEKRLASKEKGKFKDLMAKIEAFDQMVLEAQQSSSGELPKELREYFEKNSVLRRALRFLGGKFSSGALAGGGWALNKTGKGLALAGKGSKEALKKTWEFVKTHPKGTAISAGLIASVFLTGTFALPIGYGIYRGARFAYKKGNELGGKNK